MEQDIHNGKSGGFLPQNRSILLIALGSNMNSEAGDPTESLQFAVAAMSRQGALIRSRSKLYRTPAFPPGAGPDFVNAVIAVDAPWSARDTMSRLHGIEADMGRRRRERWGKRPIDLDLLAIGSDVRPDMRTVRTWMNLPLAEQQQTAPGQLILPHPRLHERAFVLVPLADVAPDWVHPVLRRSVSQMLDALPQDARDEVVPLPDTWQ
ncbi:MAG: 2-amino-4-hydroxy-6-hydroxymethyldihydropteridine diphosphokinase [Pseudomonadota bacterium]